MMTPAHADDRDAAAAGKPAPAADDDLLDRSGWTPRDAALPELLIDLTIEPEIHEAHADLEPWLTARIDRICRAVPLRAGQLSVAVVGDAAMAQLHMDYRQVSGTTDVLSFDLREDAADPTPDGELVVCYDEAVRQARKHGHGIREELLLYVVHGLLHLLGYDDRDPAQSKAIHQREDELLSDIGVGAVYRRDRNGQTK